MLLPKFYQRSGLPYVIYLDKDSGGRDLKAMLIANGIPEQNIVSAGDVIQRDCDFELEDTVGAGYHAAVRRIYPQLEVAAPDASRGKCTKYYEEALRQAHGIGFSKKRVAGEVKSALLAQRVADDDTQHLRQIVQRLWDVLQTQTRPG